VWGCRNFAKGSLVFQLQEAVNLIKYSRKTATPASVQMMANLPSAQLGSVIYTGESEVCHWLILVSINGLFSNAVSNAESSDISGRMINEG
jgi:hypothetical protein